VLFGFPIDIDANSTELLKSKRFIMHASYLIQMIDCALNMLGPDIELLTEMMTDLGVKHVAYGVKPEYFPIMGRCLITVLADCLGDSFTDTVKQAWVETYDALAQDMIRAQVQHHQQRKSSSA
jgi:hemoglobin-like flavoprotein